MMRGPSSENALLTRLLQYTGPRRLLAIFGLMLLTVGSQVLAEPQESRSQSNHRGITVDEGMRQVDWTHGNQATQEPSTYSVIVVADYTHSSNLFRDGPRTEAHTRGVISVQFAPSVPSGDLIIDAAGQPSNAFMVSHDERANKRVRIIHTSDLPPAVKMTSNQVRIPLVCRIAEQRSCVTFK